jgi:4-nitrophenyl phosphatase
VKDYALWLLDLDGTMYRGAEKIEDAPVFVRRLQNIGADFLFVTNNSSKTPTQVVEHLARFDIPAQPGQVYTSAMATARYVTEDMSRPRVYMIGENGLYEALQHAGCIVTDKEQDVEHVDFVVIGIDRKITYEKLAKATRAVRAGAKLVSTNKDRAIPTEQGLVPGNGSLTSVVSLAANTDPVWIGKPERMMIDLILQDKHVDRQQVIMVGDNYETDIMAGIQAGVDTAIVFTGFTSPEELVGKSAKPTYCWRTLTDFMSENPTR